MRPQWRSTGVPSPQLGTNTAQSHYLHSSQHLQSNQSQVSHSPRQHSTPATISRHQHAASPGTSSQQQRPSPGLNSHHQHASPGTSHQQHSSPGTAQQQRPSPGIPVNSHHQHASPGTSQQQRPSPGIINSQQRSGVWGGANVGQWHATTSSVNQALGGGATAAASEHRWRPAQRMRGSITNTPLGHVALGTASPSAVQQQRAPPVNTISSVQTTHGISNTATNANSVPVPRFQMGMPAPNNNQAANNISLYNGTTWVNAPDFSSPLPAPLFSEGWNFDDNFNLPGLPH